MGTDHREITIQLSDFIFKDGIH